MNVNAPKQDIAGYCKKKINEKGDFEKNKANADLKQTDVFGYQIVLNIDPEYLINPQYL